MQFICFFTILRKGAVEEIFPWFSEKYEIDRKLN